MSTQAPQIQISLSGPFQHLYKVDVHQIKRAKWSLKAFIQGKKTILLVVQIPINTIQNKIYNAQAMIKLVQRTICGAQSVIKLAQRTICGAQSIIKPGQRTIFGAQSVIKPAQNIIYGMQAVIKLAQRTICDVQSIKQKFQIELKQNKHLLIQVFTGPRYRQTDEQKGQSLFNNLYDKSGRTNSRRNQIIFNY